MTWQFCSCSFIINNFNVTRTRTDDGRKRTSYTFMHYIQMLYMKMLALKVTMKMDLTQIDYTVKSFPFNHFSSFSRP